MNPEKLQETIRQTPGQYYRLVVLVGASGGGKTATLQALAKEHGYPLLNLNLELSKKLLELPRTQWSRQVSRLIKEMITAAGEIVLLDNLEILFDPVLEIDPLRMLQTASRNRTLVVAWGGEYRDETLTYAEPGHPEFTRYNPVEALVLTTTA